MRGGDIRACGFGQESRDRQSNHLLLYPIGETRRRARRGKPSLAKIGTGGDDLPAPISHLKEDAWTCQTIQGRKSRSEEHTSELQSPVHLVCRLLLEKKKKKKIRIH